MQSVGPLVVKFAGAGGGGKLVGVLDAGFVHDGGENFGAAHFVFVDGTAGQAEIAELFVGVDRAAAVDALFQVVDACNLVQTVFGNDIQGFFVLKGLFVESGNFLYNSSMSALPMFWASVLQISISEKVARMRVSRAIFWFVFFFPGFAAILFSVG